MILTKDNLIKFVQEKKYVTPTDVSKAFSTTTLVASAALSQLVDQKVIGVTYLKVGSTPYYYDLNQKEALQELAEKHLGKNELLVYKRLKAEKIINDNSLTAVEKLAMQKIKDFALPLEVEFDNLHIKFWVWYLLDIEKTRKEIIDALKNYSNNNSIDSNSNGSNNRSLSINTGSSESLANNSVKSDKSGSMNGESETKSISRSDSQNFSNLLSNDLDVFVRDTIDVNSQNKELLDVSKITSKKENKKGKRLNGDEESKRELIIERFLIDNLFKIEKKETDKSYIIYYLIYLNSPFKIKFKAIFFKKKVSEVDVFKFYSNINLPLLIIGEKISKRIKDLSNKLDNLFILEL